MGSLQCWCGLVMGLGCHNHSICYTVMSVWGGGGGGGVAGSVLYPLWVVYSVGVGWLWG